MKKPYRQKTQHTAKKKQLDKSKIVALAVTASAVSASGVGFEGIIAEASEVTTFDITKETISEIIGASDNSTYNLLPVDTEGNLLGAPIEYNTSAKNYTLTEGVYQVEDLSLNTVGQLTVTLDEDTFSPALEFEVSGTLGATLIGILDITDGVTGTSIASKVVEKLPNLKTSEVLKGLTLKTQGGDTKNQELTQYTESIYKLPADDTVYKVLVADKEVGELKVSAQDGVLFTVKKTATHTLTLKVQSGADGIVAGSKVTYFEKVTDADVTSTVTVNGFEQGKTYYAKVTAEGYKDTTTADFSLTEDTLIIVDLEKIVIEPVTITDTDFNLGEITSIDAVMGHAQTPTGVKALELTKTNGKYAHEGLITVHYTDANEETRTKQFLQNGDNRKEVIAVITTDMVKSLLGTYTENEKHYLHVLGNGANGSFSLGDSVYFTAETSAGSLGIQLYEDGEEVKRVPFSYSVEKDGAVKVAKQTGLNLFETLGAGFGGVIIITTKVKSVDNTQEITVFGDLSTLDVKEAHIGKIYMADTSQDGYGGVYFHLDGTITAPVVHQLHFVDGQGTADDILTEVDSDYTGSKTIKVEFETTAEGVTHTSDSQLYVSEENKGKKAKITVLGADGKEVAIADGVYAETDGEFGFTISEVKEPTDEEPTDEEPTDEEPTDEEPTDEEPTDEEPTDEEPTDEEPTDEEPTDEEPTDEEPTDEEPTDKEPTDEEPTDKEPTDEEPTDEEPTDEEPTDEEPTDEELTDVVDSKIITSTFEVAKMVTTKTDAKVLTTVDLKTGVNYMDVSVTAKVNGKEVEVTTTPEAENKKLKLTVQEELTGVSDLELTLTNGEEKTEVKTQRVIIDAKFQPVFEKFAKLQEGTGYLTTDAVKVMYDFAILEKAPELTEDLDALYASIDTHLENQIDIADALYDHLDKLVEGNEDKEPTDEVEDKFVEHKMTLSKLEKLYGDKLPSTVTQDLVAKYYDLLHFNIDKTLFEEEGDIAIIIVDFIDSVQGVIDLDESKLDGVENLVENLKDEARLIAEYDYASEAVTTLASLLVSPTPEGDVLGKLIGDIDLLLADYEEIEADDTVITPTIVNYLTLVSETYKLGKETSKDKVIEGVKTLNDKVKELKHTKLKEQLTKEVNNVMTKNNITSEDLEKVTKAENPDKLTVVKHSMTLTKLKELTGKDAPAKITQALLNSHYDLLFHNIDAELKKTDKEKAELISSFLENYENVKLLDTTGYDTLKAFNGVLHKEANLTAEYNAVLGAFDIANEINKGDFKNKMGLDTAIKTVKDLKTVQDKELTVLLQNYLETYNNATLLTTTDKTKGIAEIKVIRKGLETFKNTAIKKTVEDLVTAYMEKVSISEDEIKQDISELNIGKDYKLTTNKGVVTATTTSKASDSKIEATLKMTDVDQLLKDKNTKFVVKTADGLEIQIDITKLDLTTIKKDLATDATVKVTFEKTTAGVTFKVVASDSKTTKEVKNLGSFAKVIIPNALLGLEKPVNGKTTKSRVFRTSDSGNIAVLGKMVGDTYELFTQYGGTFIAGEPVVKTAVADLANFYNAKGMQEFVERGILVMDANDKFSPNNPMKVSDVTRAFVVSLGDGNNDTIKDVLGKSIDSYLTTQTGRYIEQGSEITREDTAVLMHELITRYDNTLLTKVLDQKGTTSNGKKSLSDASYNDIGDVSTNAKESVAYMQHLGIMTGKTASVFDPKASLTKSQFTKVLGVTLNHLGFMDNIEDFRGSNGIKESVDLKKEVTTTTPTDTTTKTDTATDKTNVTAKGEVLLNTNGVKITYQGLDLTDKDEPKILLNIDNGSSKTVTAQIREMSVDNKMHTNTVFSAIVNGGKQLDDDISFIGGTMPSFNDNIEFTLKVYTDGESLTKAMSEDVVIKLK